MDSSVWMRSIITKTVPNVSVFNATAHFTTPILRQNLTLEAGAVSFGSLLARSLRAQR